MFSFRNMREALIVVSALLFSGLVLSLGTIGVEVFKTLVWWCFVALFIMLEILLVSMIVRQPTDPWAVQKKIMEMSDQRAPGIPTMTRDSLTYFALCAEELGETGQGLVRWSLPWIQPHLAKEEPSPFSDRHLGTVLMQIGIAAKRMQDDAKVIREHVERVSPDWSRALSRQEAKEILDGSTDLVVTACGLTIASGMPGASAYAEVQGSNMSKANPVTNKIDKDKSGKWVKGSLYIKPDLDKVLEEALDDSTSPGPWFGGTR